MTYDSSATPYDYYQSYTQQASPPRIGWPDSPPGGRNAAETSVQGMRRIPIAGLRLGNHQAAQVNQVSESAAGRAIVLEQLLRDHYRLTPVGSLIPQGQSPNHDHLFGLGNALQNALASLAPSAAAPALSQPAAVGEKGRVESHRLHGGKPPGSFLAWQSL